MLLVDTYRNQARSWLLKSSLYLERCVKNLLDYKGVLPSIALSSANERFRITVVKIAYLHEVLISYFARFRLFIFLLATAYILLSFQL